MNISFFLEITFQSVVFFDKYPGIRITILKEAKMLRSFRFIGVIAFMAITFPFPVSAGGSTEASGRGGQIRIGVTLETKDAFLAYVDKGLQQFAGETSNLTIEVLDADYDAETQVKHTLDFIDRGFDAVIIKTTDPDATKPISEACMEAGIPLIAVNSEINSPSDTYVGSDNKAMGVAQAKYLAEQSGGKGNVAILVGDPSHDAARDRTDGFREVIAQYPEMTIIAEIVGFWDRDRGRDIARSWIDADLDVDIVMGDNDEMIIGAVEAYEEAGEAGQMLFGGIDATEAALKMMQEGRLNVTVFQNGLMQGYTAAKSAYQLIQKQSLPSYVDVPYELVPPEKVQDILDFLK